MLFGDGQIESLIDIVLHDSASTRLGKVTGQTECFCRIIYGFPESEVPFPAFRLCQR
jgi:hypothetical protein